MDFVDYTKEIKEEEMAKRILFLGAGVDQIAAIKYAKEQGYYVITCDYLPGNLGHEYADEYHNVSTINKEAVLELAKKLNIDGVLGFGTDANAPTQAYVGNTLGLRSNPYESVLTLTRKDLFRSFLKKHDFYTPNSKSFLSYDDVVGEISSFIFPVIVKPVDSSGSNGVSKIDTIDKLKNAYEYAEKFSREKAVLIEEFFNYENSILNGDGFLVDGKIVFSCYGNTQRNELANPLVPVGTKFPSSLSIQRIEYAMKQIQRVCTLLNMNNGPFNIEFGFDENNNFLIFDFGPRNGGVAVPTIIKYATGVDLIKYTVENALGLDCSELKMKKVNGFFSEYKIHAEEEGFFSRLWYSEEIKRNIIDQNISVQTGDKVQIMNRGTDRLGLIYLKFDSYDEMQDKMNNMKKYFKVIVDKVTV